MLRLLETQATYYQDEEGCWKVKVQLHPGQTHVDLAIHCVSSEEESEIEI